MNDSELDLLLNASGPPTAAPPGFQRDVWCRIETAEFASWKSRSMRLLERALATIALPRVAFATCAALAITGAWIGHKNDSPNGNSQLSYVRSISPFTQSSR